MKVIKVEDFSHGTIGLYSADENDYYVSLIYIRHNKHGYFLKKECTNYEGLNALDNALSAYDRKREYMGTLKSRYEKR